MPSFHYRRLSSLILPSFFFLIAILFFFLAFPNPIFRDGLPVFGWLLLIPLIFLIDSIPLAISPIVGFVWGYSAWTVYAHWLSDFHPMAGFVGAFVKAMILALVFPVFSLSRHAGKTLSWAIRLCAWVVWEYAGSLGYLGFPYGAIGYSQWRVLPFIQTASIGGVWFVASLTIFPAILFATMLGSEGENGRPERLRSFDQVRNMRLPPRKRWLSPLIVYLSILALSIPLSHLSYTQQSERDSINVLLIQPNSDPWKNGFHEYRRELENLIYLSDRGLKEHPKTEVVIWPETAFVPRIYWHRTFREDRDYWGLVRTLLDYLDSKKLPDGSPMPFIIGNHDARPYLRPDGSRGQYDYNAAILFEGSDEKAIYRKRHLVPFTEHFPYERQFPAIHQALLEADTHFWDKGTHWTLLPVRGLKVATPICYEDSFGYITRAFAHEGADFIAVLSNDAWANSRTSQIQHASMAVFRSIETRLPLVRSTASGETMVIAPSGAIVDWAPSMQKSYLALDLPVYTDSSTLYRRWGDWFPRFCALALVLLTLAGALRYTIGKRALGA